MSVVLAFGLSPLGQVPAYAAQDKQPAQQEQMLQTQAREYSFSDSVEFYEYSGEQLGSTVSKFTYNGAPQTFAVQAIDAGGPDINNTYAGETPKIYYAAALSYTDANGKTTKLPGAVAENDFGGYDITLDKAGDYTLTLSGGTASDEAGKYRGSKEYSIKVGQFDISETVFAQPDDVPSYDGTNIEVSLVQAKGTEASIPNYKEKEGFDLEWDAEEEGLFYVPTGEGDPVAAEDADLICQLQEGDFELGKFNYKDADVYDIPVTGAGNCTGSAYGQFAIAKARLTEDASAVTLNDVSLEELMSDGPEAGGVEGAVYAGTLGDEEDVFVPVPLNKASSPVSLEYKGLPLSEGTDYEVTYYQYDSENPWKLTKEVAAKDLAKQLENGVYADIKVKEWAQNFADDERAEIIAVLKLAEASEIEAFVDHAVFPAGTYLAGAYVAPATTGATFYDAEGNDVTSLVGDKNYKAVAQSFSILATNTAHTAALVNVDADSGKGNPAGAGKYTGLVTGAGKYTAAAEPTVPVTYEIQPRAAKEAGTTPAKGDLLVTVEDLGYAEGKYIKANNVTVEMYIDDEGTTKEVAKQVEDVSGLVEQPEDEDADKVMVTNYTVTYSKDGKTVSYPAEVGTYTAKIEFSGNLAGTPAITKEFEVATGNIATLVKSIHVKDYDWTAAAWNDYRTGSPYTGNPVEITKDDIVLVGENEEGDAVMLTADDLPGTDFAVSFEAGPGAALDEATGLPLIPGAYTVKAEFSGNNTGTVTTRYQVGKLDLRNLTAAAGTPNADFELQYEQPDGSFNTVFSSGKTGSEIAPNVQIALKDGKQKTSEPTLVNPAVYQATFSDNVNAGSAKVLLAAKSGYGSYVTASPAAQAQAFAITEKSLAGATMTLGKSSIDYTAAADLSSLGITVSVEVAEGFLKYGIDYNVTAVDPDGENVAVTMKDSADATVKTIESIGESLSAGTYKIVVGPVGENPVYGGTVVKTLEVKPMSIEDTDAFVVTYSGMQDKGGNYYAAFLDDEWSTEYEAGEAMKVAGITLAADKITVRSVDASIGDEGVLEQGVDYKLSYEDNKAAGTAKLTIEGAGDFDGTIEKAFTIKRAELSNEDYQVDFVSTSTFVKDDNLALGATHRTSYTGSAITPEFEVNHLGVDGKPDYKLEDAYTFQWINNTNVTYNPVTPDVIPGAYLRITASGNYEGTLDGIFQIDPVDLYNNSNVTVEDIADVPFTGSPVLPDVTVKLNGVALTQGTDYVVTSDNDGSVGIHTAYVASANKGNVTVSTPIAKQFTIKKAEEISYDLTGATVALSKTSFTYNKKAQAPTVTSVTLADGTLLDSALYTATIPSSKAAGSYTVQVKGATDNVTGTATAKYTIAKAANTLKVAKATRTVKYAKLKKAAQKVTGLKVSTAGQGTMVYKVTKVTKGGKSVAKANFKLASSAKNKLTVKKGLAKGTYKVTMTAKAKGNANYNASSKLKKVVTVVVK